MKQRKNMASRKVQTKRVKVNVDISIFIIIISRLYSPINKDIEI
jgi:hypothetical protein